MATFPMDQSQAQPQVPFLDDLSVYVLPGWLVDPTTAPADAALADELGLGTAWISEKWDQKDPGILLGAMSQTTSDVRLGVGVTHPHTRHPLVLASLGSTLQALSGGRGVIGIGRGNDQARPWADMGLPVPTTVALRDIAHLLKRLWRGETVTYDGPLGTFPSIRMNNLYEGTPPPLMIAAYGPKTLAMAGETYDGVITVPFLTTESIAKMVETVRRSAVDSGRDAAAVRIVHPLVVAPGLPQERQAAVLGGRFVRYVQHAGSPNATVPALNGWDTSVVEAVQAHPILEEIRSTQVRPAMRDDLLAEVADELIPPDWLREGGAVGTPAECARRIRDYIDAGVDEIILHGCRPHELGELVSAYRELKAA